MWTSLGTSIHMPTAGEGWGHVPPPGQVQKSCLCLRVITAYSEAPCQDQTSAEPNALPGFPEPRLFPFLPSRFLPTSHVHENPYLRLCFQKI